VNIHSEAGTQYDSRCASCVGGTLFIL